MEGRRVCFKDLSPSLKTAIVFAWIVGALNIISFAVGFFWGLLGVFLE